MSESNPPPPITDSPAEARKGQLASLSCSDLLDELIEEVDEEATYIFLTSISIYGIENREHALTVMKDDSDCRKWAEMTLALIPKLQRMNDATTTSGARQGLESTPCSCHLCNPDAWWMVVCAKCGNKRCPHATDHHHECTNSNEPDQESSIYCTNDHAVGPEGV